MYTLKVHVLKLCLQCRAPYGNQQLIEVLLSLLEIGASFL